MIPITSFLKRRKHRQPESHSSTAGFTLIEMLVVVAIVGIFAAMAGASYLGWMARMRVSAAQDVALQAIRQAQSTAKQKKATWQASFWQVMNDDGKVDKVKWAVHPQGAVPVPTDETLWNTISEPDIQVDTATTNLSGSGTASEPWSLLFNYKGQLEGQATVDGKSRKITLTNKSATNKRCVMVKTILGALQTASDDKCT